MAWERADVTGFDLLQPVRTDPPIACFMYSNGSIHLFDQRYVFSGSRGLYRGLTRNFGKRASASGAGWTRTNDQRIMSQPSSGADSPLNYD